MWRYFNLHIDTVVCTEEVIKMISKKETKIVVKDTPLNEISFIKFLMDNNVPEDKIEEMLDQRRKAMWELNNAVSEKHV